MTHSGQSKILNMEPFAAYCFVGGAICQGLSLIFTLFPWTRNMGDRYAGYEAFAPLEWKYDGTAGFLNLFISSSLLLLVALTFCYQSNRLYRLYAFLALAWNLPFGIWLIVIMFGLGILSATGITLTLIVVIASVFLFLGVIVSLRTEVRSQSNAVKHKRGRKSRKK